MPAEVIGTAAASTGRRRTIPNFKCCRHGCAEHHNRFAPDVSGACADAGSSRPGQERSGAGLPPVTVSTAFATRRRAARGGVRSMAGPSLYCRSDTLPSAATPNQPIRVSGMIVRTSAGERPEQFSAVCVRCPHELCDVDYVDDPKRLPQEVVERDRAPCARTGLRVPMPQQHVQGRRRAIVGPRAARPVPFSRNRRQRCGCRDCRGRRRCADLYLVSGSDLVSSSVRL